MDSAEHSEHHGYGLGGSFSAEPCGKRHAGFAFMENEHGPRALADDEVTFPMADVLWPIMDGGAVFNCILGGPRPTRPPALVTARQIAPELCAFAGGTIDEAVDGLVS